MKNLTLFLCLFVSSIMTAQIDFTASSLSGYESNINKAPKTLEMNGDFLDKEDLYLNSIYQDVIFRFKYSKKWGQSSFGAYITPEVRYYFSETEANQLIFNSRLTYKYTIKKNLRWENSFQYKIKDREGQDLDENELSVPFGYNLLNLNSGLRFRLYKNNRSFVRLNYGSKKFDNSNSRSVQYNLYGFNGEFKNIKWKNHLLHSYGIIFGYTNRDYKIINFSNNSNGNRTWKYLDAGIFYKLPINKQWFMQPEISYQKRTDKTNDAFGYSQIRPEITISYETARLLAKLNTSYTKRGFDNLNAENSNNVVIGALDYDYLRIRGDVEYNINNKLSFVFEGYLLDRKSNNTNVTTTAYRSYTNSYVGIGLRYQF